MIQFLVFFMSGVIAGSVIVLTLARHGDRIRDALAGRPIRPAPEDQRWRRVWSRPRERLPLATRHLPEFKPVRSR